VVPFPGFYTRSAANSGDNGKIQRRDTLLSLDLISASLFGGGVPEKYQVV